MMKTISTIANAFSSMFFFVVGMGILGYALHEFASLTEGKVIILFAYSIVMFLMAFRDSLSGFSVFGLKVELQKKINEVDAVIQDLRNLAKLVLSPTVMTVASMGRWGSGFSLKEKHDFKISAESVMCSLNIPEKEIEDAFLELHKYNLHDLMKQANQPALELISQKVKEKKRAHNENFQGANTPHDEYRRSIEEIKYYAECEGRFKKHGRDDSIFKSYQILIREIQACTILTDAEKEQLCADTTALLDLKYYCQHKNFRKPETLPIEI